MNSSSTMSSFYMGNRRKPGVVTMFRLLIAFVLLSGVFIIESPSRCLVSAQGNNDKNNNKNNEKNNDKNNDKNNNDKNNDKNNDDKNDKNNDKNNNDKNNDKNNDDKNDKNNDKNNDENNEKNKDTESPSMAPSRYPTLSPTQKPTRFPTKSPTFNPTSVPTRLTLEAKLPDINIDITTVVDDVFSFAALLLDSGDIETSNTNDLDNRDGLKAYFESFVVDLLIASGAVPPSLLESVDVQVKFLPLENEEQGSTKASSTTRNAPNSTPVRIDIRGTMKYQLDEEVSGEEGGILSLEDKISHILEVYFTFWSTDEMRASLSQYGLTEPQITAVRVDDKLILIADADSSNGGDDNDGSDNGNVLVAPTDDVEMDNTKSSTAESGARTSAGKSQLFSFALSTVGVSIATILSYGCY